MAGLLTRIDVRLAGDTALGAGAVRAVLPAGARLVPAGTRTAALSGMIAAFDLNLTALSLLALVFGMFLIYNTMTFSVVQRRELLGSLRALGVTRREVLAGVLREAAWVGLAGSAVGLALGVVMGRGLVRMVTRTINDLYFAVSVERLALPPGVLVKGALLGVGATLLAALPPALEAAAAPPRMARTRSVIEDSARRAVPRAAVAGTVLLLAGALTLVAPTPLAPRQLRGPLPGDPGDGAPHAARHGPPGPAGAPRPGARGGDPRNDGRPRRRDRPQSHGAGGGRARRRGVGHRGPRRDDPELPGHVGPLAHRNARGRRVRVRAVGGAVPRRGNARPRDGAGDGVPPGRRPAEHSIGAGRSSTGPAPSA